MKLTLTQVQQNLPVGVRLVVNRKRKIYALSWFDFETGQPLSKVFNNQIDRQSIIDYAKTIKAWNIIEPCLQVGDIIELEQEGKRWAAKVVDWINPFYYLEIKGFGNKKHYVFNQYSLFVYNRVSMPF